MMARATRKQRATQSATAVVIATASFFTGIGIAGRGGHGSCLAHPERPQCSGVTTTTVSGGTTTTIPTPPGGTPITPADTGAQICGNATILNGPASAPAGATVISTSVFSLSAGAGTPTAQKVYYFTAGTHYLQDPAAPVYSGTGTITKGSNVITAVTPAVPTLATDGSLTVSGVAGGSAVAGQGKVFIGARVQARTATSITVHTTPSASATNVPIKVFGTYNQIGVNDYVTLTGAPGAIIDGQGANASAVVGDGKTGVIVEHLTFQNFATGGDEGGINPGGTGHNWTIRFNTLQGFGGASVMLGTGDTLTQNCIRNNSQYGFSGYEGLAGDVGPSNVTVSQNEITNNDIDRIDQRAACTGQPTDPIPCSNGNFGGAKLWQTVDATVFRNYVHNNFAVGIWFDSDNVGAQFNRNYVSGSTGIGLVYEVSYNAQIQNNNFQQNDLLHGPLENSGFPEGAIYISESGGETRGRAGTRGARHYSTVDVGNNIFKDNWGTSVGLWESSNRFCGNGEVPWCTLDNNLIPNTPNGGPCFNQTTVQSSPWKDDCRWKTQNISVHDNSFSIQKSTVDTAVAAAGGGSGKCTANTFCGTNAIFSQFGDFPAWNPYTGFQISDQMLSLTSGTARNLHYANNTYIGPWTFVAHDSGVIKTFAQWQAAPLSQDAGSTCTCAGGGTMRTINDPLYGVTLDNVAGASQGTLDAIDHALVGQTKFPTARILFGAGNQPSDYSTAVTQFKPDAYLMGELLDSSGIAAMSAASYAQRTTDYLAALGNDIDIWEVGEEANATIAGTTASVVAKVTDAANQVSAAAKKSAITLSENSWGTNNCGNGVGELTPQQFSNQLTQPVRNTIDYVFLSWYPRSCTGKPNGNSDSIAPSTIVQEMVALRGLYPNAKVGFGEVGLKNGPIAGDATKLSQSQAIVSYYYGLNLAMPNWYVGGYFYWNWQEDAIPETNPMFDAVRTGMIAYPVVEQQPSLPIRAAFYYPWFPESWNQQGFNPFTNYHPSLGFYNGADPAVISNHVGAMQYAGMDAGIASWWGQGTATDAKIQLLLTGAAQTTFRWGLYYENESTGDPSVAQLTSDLSYIDTNYGTSSTFLRVGGKPVIFVYTDGLDACPMATRWKQANNAVGGRFYVVIKVFNGFAACADQPDGWHQYGPSTPIDHHVGNSVTVSPGFWKKGEATPRLVRDTAAFTTNLTTMKNSGEPWQLITTFNEWGEGSSIESATEWPSGSGYGTYIDIMHNVFFGAPLSNCGGSGSPPTLQKVVVFSFENRTWGGVGGTQFQTMPYFHGLAQQCSTFANYTEPDPTQNSATQYVTQWDGNLSGNTVRSDCVPSSSCQSLQDNIGRQIRTAGKTVRSYVEGASTTCSTTGNVSKHIPALYFLATQDSSQCANEVKPLSQFDPNNLADFSFITPTLCNDGHDCANSVVDTWASSHVQAVLDSAAYKAGNVTVFIWYDEDTPVPNMQLNARAIPGVKSTAINFGSTLRAWEDMMGVPHITAAVSAVDMRPLAGI